MALLRRDRALEFATKHHRNVRGEPMEFDAYFYMLDVLADPSPNVVIQSAVQTGKSEAMVCSLFADCSLALSCFYVLPTTDTRNVFVANRINRLTTMVPLYGAMVARKSGNANSVILKHIGPGVVRFGASQSMTEFKEFPADVLYVDEYDVCEPKGLAFALDRTKASPYRFTKYLANPIYPGTDGRQNINWHFNNSDGKRVQYRCAGCGLVQPLLWMTNVAREISKGGIVTDFAPRLEADGHILPVCARCEHPISRRRDVVGWVPTGDPNHPVSGYLISRLNCLNDSIDDLWRTFRTCAANETKMQVFINSDLGEAYSGGTGNKISEELMATCAEPYELPQPGRCRGPCTMGIDVGATLDVRISDYVRDDDGKVRRRLVHAAKLRHPHEVIEIGQAFRVAVAVIDAYPESRMALDLQDKAPFRVWRCQYKANEGKNVKSLSWHPDEGLNGRERYLTVDRTEAMDTVFQQYIRREVVEPQGFGALLGGRYVNEMTAPVRAVDDDERPFWVKTVDHQFHANVYDWIASQDPIGGFWSSREGIVRGSKAKLGTDADYGATKVLAGLGKRRSVPTWQEVL
jgi:hypothetical protein